MKIVPGLTWLNRRVDKGKLPKRRLKLFLCEKRRSLPGCKFGLRSKAANPFQEYTLFFFIRTPNFGA